MELIKPLLPSQTALALETLQFNLDPHYVDIQVVSTQTSADCPCCSQPSESIHSYYTRTVTDLPWADWRVCLSLSVRKFRCHNDACTQKIFCQRLPEVVAARGRKTFRLLAQQHHIVLALGGQAGSRIAHHLDRPASRNTLLRLIRTTPRAKEPTPRVLGVDDWAKCKGVDYGTVLIDIERGRVLELLSDRKAETLSQWLQANPGVEIICRDRAQAYAEGASAGAPDAVQVADRFHLLGNLAEALQRIFESHQKLLLRVGSESEAPPIITDEIAPQDFGLKEDGPASNTLVLPSVDLTPAGQVRRAQRRQNYEQVKTLFAQGWTKRAIARHLDMSRTTVQRYIQTENFRERQCPASKLDPYKAHLLQRWNAGCRTGTLLYNEIVQIGYCGQRSHVLAYITRLRKAQGLSSRSRLLHPGHEIRDPAAEVLTPRQATWLVLRPEEKLKDEDRAQLAQLIQADVHLKETITLTQDFAHMLRERQGEKLEAWLHRAERSSMAPMRGFVRGLRRDYDAVKAGLTLPWSSGPVEGQINRLKLIKRQMYGRAKIDLLEKRVVQVA